MRINKYIASCGLCSRRKAEEYINDGKVKVNGKVIINLATDINEKSDVVEVDGKKLLQEKKKIYIMLNKPRGYVTTVKEQFDRDSVMELIHEDERVYPIGRLDMYTEGLLLLTNDGNFANEMMHPKNQITKTYIAKVVGEITQEKLNNLRKGVDIGGYVTRPAKVEIKKDNLLVITISEGKNRQIRRMCETQELIVNNLKRVRVGNLKLENLPLGKYRYLTSSEVNGLINKK